MQCSVRGIEEVTHRVHKELKFKQGIKRYAGIGIGTGDWILMKKCIGKL